MKNTNILQLMYKIITFHSVLMKLDQTQKTSPEKTKKHWLNYINFVKMTSSWIYSKGTCQQLQSWDLISFSTIVTWKLSTPLVILFQLLWTLCDLCNQIFHPTRNRYMHAERFVSFVHFNLSMRPSYYFIVFYFYTNNKFDVFWKFRMQCFQIWKPEIRATIGVTFGR